MVEVEEFGCKASDSIYLIENPLENLEILDDKSACIGDTVEIYAQIPGESDFIWFDSDSSSLHKSITESGTYSITVSKFGCDETDFSDIYFYSNPELNLGNDTIMCNDFTIEYNLRQDGTIVWDDGSTDFLRSIEEEGLYWATLASDQGCITSDTILISTLDCETEIILPNIFTPNNDGVNDKFVPIITKNVFSPLLSIFNRWGNKVFYSTNLDKGWNGNILGKNEYCPAGTYIWMIEYEDFFGTKKSLKGAFYLNK